MLFRSSGKDGLETHRSAIDRSCVGRLKRPLEFAISSGALKKSIPHTIKTKRQDQIYAPELMGSLLLQVPSYKLFCSRVSMTYPIGSNFRVSMLGEDTSDIEGPAELMPSLQSFDITRHHGISVNIVSP